ncbi:MAG: hypothetical protein GPJ54_06840, partial [Candidatus Heimdallarchaeota archaeon]|nr:hypothetical protein [Candidatus Heimdallarchaeota archaeon]
GDLMVYFPIFLIGTIGVSMGTTWGYILYSAAGLMAIYFSIIFWVAERKYTISTNGPIMYYTFFWGFFMYWGIIAFAYSMIRIENIKP